MLVLDTSGLLWALDEKGYFLPGCDFIAFRNSGSGTV